jgi:hypothetical protein
VHYLYGSKRGVERRLVATFDSEQQLRSYVRWATLSEENGIARFEQQSALAGYERWSESQAPLTEDDAEAVAHNPSPTML